MNKSANEYREENVAHIKKIWLKDFVAEGASNCPNKKCRSEEIWGQLDDGTDFYSVPMKCDDCGATWVNVFDVVRATDLEIPGI